MRNPVVELLEELLVWLRSGEDCCLCTVVATYGSAPRQAGSLFACNAKGQRFGSLSGGCVEDALLESLDWSSLKTYLHEFGASVEEQERLRLPCGGTMTILLEALNGEQAIEYINELLHCLAKRSPVVRTLSLSGKATIIQLSAAKPSVTVDEQWVHHVMAPRHIMLLLGAGDLSQSVAQMALALDFDVKVCDPREDFRLAWAVDGVAVSAEMPDDAVRNMSLGEADVVLALSHDPRVDDMGLMEALLQPMLYVGALGSQRTAAKRRQRLQVLGLSEQQIARLHAPVGLAIGAKTPTEIAVAIMAQLLEKRTMFGGNNHE